MLAFDFRLIYNPTRLCLGGLFRKQTMVVGGAAVALWVAWDLSFPLRELAMPVLSLLFLFYL